MSNEYVSWRRHIILFAVTLYEYDMLYIYKSLGFSFLSLIGALASIEVDYIFLLYVAPGL